MKTNSPTVSFWKKNPKKNPYLNQYLFQAPAAERQQVADAIAASSPISWQHINLHGEFDFSDDALKDSLCFDVEALFTFQWEPPAGPLV